MKRGASLALALGIAYGLKHFFASASVAELDWILRPTTWLVERLSGVPFQRETGIGYFSQETRFAILPVCSGVNFLIVAFVSAVVLNEGRFARMRDKLVCAAISLIGAYALTVVTNAIRIAIAIPLHMRQIAFGWWTEARVHETQGVIVYVSMLLLASWAVSRTQVEA